MINYSRYCEECKEFFSTFRTKFKTRERSYGYLDERETLCPKCGESFGAITCSWMLIVGHHYPNWFVRKYCIGLDKLEKLCYNCDNRFMCWTGSL